MMPSVAFDNPAKWLKEETLIGRLNGITFLIVAVKWISPGYLCSVFLVQNETHCTILKMNGSCGCRLSSPGPAPGRGTEVG